MRTLLALTATLSVVLWAGTATAASGSYTGNWPVKVRMPPHFGDTDCLMLTDNGTAGSRHSGPVSSTGGIAPGLTGTFQVVRGLMVVNLQGGSDNGEVYYLTFVAPARDGTLGKGVFNDPGSFPVEPLVFGTRGGC